MCLSNLEGERVQALASHQELLEVGDFDQHACNLGSEVRSVDESTWTWSLFQDECHVVVDEVPNVASLCLLVGVPELLA